MKNIFVIGAGGVSSVTVQKMSMLKNDFNEIILASRTIERCRVIKELIKKKFNFDIKIEQLNADHTNDVVKLLKKYKPDIVLNLALPYQDLTIMEACLREKVHYLDTANYEPKNEAKFEYKWQWDLHNNFSKKGLMALLGCGFDPGVTNVYTSYAKKHLLDEIQSLDILDCNGGDHGQPFATNFNPEINIREITANSRHFENGDWKTGKPLKKKISFNFPEIGFRNMYLMYHEELESLVKNFPEIKRARFWMTFGDEYLNYLNVLKNVGMTSIKPIDYNGKKVVPLKILKKILPDPSSLGKLTKGKTCIGIIVTGIKNNLEKTYYIYNICDHRKCYNEVGSQAISYTTGVPAMIGCLLMSKKIWFRQGVWNVEQFNPDPFIQQLNIHGLPNQTVELKNKLKF